MVTASATDIIITEGEKISSTIDGRSIRGLRRRERILENLSGASDWLPLPGLVGDLADYLNVSCRTVRDDLLALRSRKVIVFQWRKVGDEWIEHAIRRDVLDRIAAANSATARLEAQRKLDDLLGAGA